VSETLAIDVQDLTKSFGTRKVVDKFSIQVPRGQVWGFLGPNGSGKTTTIRLLCGLLVPDSGSGTCLGYDILRESAAIKRNVGYMTQKFSFYEDLSIRENLDFVARIYDVKDRKKVVGQAIEQLGLVRRQQQLAGTLSGGWKQRVALAACILHRPKLLLLDEPTAGVDPQARRDFWEQIHLLAGKGISVLVATHYMDEAERCHRLAYIAYGRLLATGTPQEILHLFPLSTWEVKGPAEVLAGLAERLHGHTGVDYVTPFGNSLHVTGSDAAALEAAIEPWRGDARLAWHASEPGLEDVFIHLMASAADNFR